MEKIPISIDMYEGTKLEYRTCDKEILTKYVILATLILAYNKPISLYSSM